MKVELVTSFWKGTHKWSISAGIILLKNVALKSFFAGPCKRNGFERNAAGSGSNISLWNISESEVFCNVLLRIVLCEIMLMEVEVYGIKLLPAEFLL